MAIIQSKNTQVIIIGAGLAGLACANTLQQNKINYMLLESDSTFGGKIQTEMHDEGFLLDRGFQVLLNSYPELNHFANLEKLNLKNFNSGALIYGLNKNQFLANPFKNPAQIIQTISSNLASVNDKFLVLKLIAISSRYSDFNDLKNISTIDYLKNFGFSNQFIQSFWVPFMAGVYLDRALSLDAGYFLFLIHCFSLGSVAIPDKGMQQLPLQLAKNLDAGQIILNTKVTSFDKNAVQLESGKIFEGQYIVQAFNKITTNYRSATTYYFTAEIDPGWDKWLVLIPPEFAFKINHLALLSAVSPDYATNNQILISATTLESDSKTSVHEIETEIEKIAHKKLNLRHLKTDHIKMALPQLKLTKNHFTQDNFSYECGDHTSSPSIQGALKAGRLTALDIINRLG